MAKKKLNKKDFTNFIEACETQGFPIKHLCLKSIFPNTEYENYILNVLADWVDEYDCSDAIDILVEFLFANSSQKVREKISRIEILSNNGNVHCKSEFDIELFAQNAI